MFFSIYPNGHNFLMQSQVIVKLENYESTHKITYKDERKIGVQNVDFTANKLMFLLFNTIMYRLAML